ncbi:MULTISPECIES: Bug family tripartite tricarboxylate transporter substrate binding protein [Ramlibacter]|nr:MULTISPECIES: tripartite tricarboxylate transporter substrate binding protein [Ramlibacter]MBA2962364.1 tripartite tricarboxylate transporter substrate binding protein [Ramlibacter sp. CGMCC 1.13660]
MTIQRRAFTFAVLGGAAFAAGAQSYPARPVRFIVPFPAGQGTDVATRHLAEQLTRSLGQNFYVDNRPGAASRLGVEMLARAAPDGYTIGIGTSGSHTINPAVFPNLGYDPDKDFEPICLTGMLPLVVAAHPAFPANSIAELVAAAKARPDSLNVALPALPQRIAFELLRQQAGAPLFPVPYKGTSTALPEVMSGQVPLIIDSLTALKPHVDSGKLKALAVTSLKSTDLMPGVKSVAEQGVQGYELTAWNAVFAPKGTPAPIVAQLGAEIRRILQQPETRQRMAALGFEIVGSTSQQLADTVRSERERWERIVRANNIQAE